MHIQYKHHNVLHIIDCQNIFSSNRLREVGRSPTVVNESTDTLALPTTGVNSNEIAAPTSRNNIRLPLTHHISDSQNTSVDRGSDRAGKEAHHIATITLGNNTDGFNTSGKDVRSEVFMSDRSFVLVLTQQEQLMASAFNYLVLQCWVRSLYTVSPISAVEPMVLRNASILGFSFADDHAPVLASDVFDIETWDSQWPKDRPPLAPLTTRKHFIDDIRKSKKKVIIVQVHFSYSKNLQCPFTWDLSSLMKEFEQYPLLNIVRKVCICVSNTIPAAEFYKLVFSNVAIENTVLIFTDWKGIGGDRVNIISPCRSAMPPYSSLKPSSSVLRDAETFAKKHLGGFGQYLSVSARFEKLVKDYGKLSITERRKVVIASINESLAKVKSLKQRTGVDNVYLAYDYGLFGSATFKQRMFYNSSKELVKFQEDLYDGKISHIEYKKSLLNFKFQNPGYIAMVQMTLSSRGRCLLLVGWGHCIDYVKSLFTASHDGPHLCIECAPHSLCSGNWHWHWK